MISFNDAKDIIDKNLPMIDKTEEIELDKALMRVCAKDVFAKENILNFKRCAVDGFAIRSEDIKLGMEKGLKIVDAIDAGEISEIAVRRGECIKVATGCKLPQNCNMVIMIEDTQIINEDKIVILKTSNNKNYDDVGSDVKKGEKILNKGEILTPPKIGLLAANGNAKIEVYGKFKIGILITGDEILSLNGVHERELKNGKIYDSNSYIIKSMLAGFFTIEHYGIVNDVKEDIDKILERAWQDDEIDIMIMTGGTSMGDKDIAYKLIEEKGDMLFHKLFIKPGKPTFLGKVKDKSIIGLPGNPTSAFIIIDALFLPILLKKSHLKFKEKRISAILDRDVETGDRDTLMPFKLKEAEGKVYAENTFKHSGAISSVSRADGYAKIPANSKLKMGQKMDVILFHFKSCVCLRDI